MTNAISASGCIPVGGDHVTNDIHLVTHIPLSKAEQVKKAETGERIQVYDAEAIPPPLRTFYKDQTYKVENRLASSMPARYDSVYSKTDLEAIVAYLKSGNF